MGLERRDLGTLGLLTATGVLLWLDRRIDTPSQLDQTAFRIKEFESQHPFIDISNPKLFIPRLVIEHAQLVHRWFGGQMRSWGINFTLPPEAIRFDTPAEDPNTKNVYFKDGRVHFLLQNQRFLSEVIPLGLPGIRNLLVHGLVESLPTQREDGVLLQALTEQLSNGNNGIAFKLKNRGFYIARKWEERLDPTGVRFPWHIETDQSQVINQENIARVLQKRSGLSVVNDNLIGAYLVFRPEGYNPNLRNLSDLRYLLDTAGITDRQLARFYATSDIDSLALTVAKADRQAPYRDPERIIYGWKIFTYATNKIRGWNWQGEYESTEDVLMEYLKSVRNK